MDQETIKEAVIKFRESRGVVSGTEEVISSQEKVPEEQKPIGGVAGFGLGILKGAADLPREAASLGSSIGNYLLGTKAGKAVAGGINTLVNPSAETVEKAKQVQQGMKEGVQMEGSVYEPKGTAQNLGYGAEKVAEFFVPGGAPKNIANLGVKGLKLGEVAKDASLVTRAAKGLGRTAVRAGVEAGVVGGQTALQTGGDAEATKSAALLGAAAVPAFGALGAGARASGKLLSGGAERIINSLIKPLQKDFAYGKNPGRGVAKEGIVANSFDELVQKITDKRKELGQAIGAALAGSKAKISSMGLLEPLDKAIATASNLKATNASLIARLNAIKADLNALLKKKVLTPEEAFRLKQIVADATKFTGNASDDSVVNKALKAIYGEIKSRINSAVKGVEGLNERFADIKSAEVAARYRDKILERQNVLPFGGKTGGAVAGAVLSGAPGAALGALLGAGVEKIMASTLLKTRLAKMLQAMSKEEVEAAKKAFPILQQIIDRLK